MEMQDLGIAGRIRHILDSEGITIKEAADRCGIPYRTLQNYLLEDREPSARVLAQLGTQFGISLDWLLTGVGGMRRGHAPSPLDLPPQEQAILRLYSSLSEDDRREIQVVAEEKKRLRDLEQRYQELRSELDQLKGSA